MAETHNAQRSGTASIIPATARSKTETVTEAVPNSRVGRICATPGCKRILALNNTSGLCGECRERQGRSHSKKTNGHGAHGLQLARRRVVSESAAPAKSNGADSDPPHLNGNGVGTVPLESRVDLLLAAMPREDKAKMLMAWLAGTL
jgi:hypothetical protein